jgi:hypothetical protein
VFRNSQNAVYITIKHFLCLDGRLRHQVSEVQWMSILRNRDNNIFFTSAHNSHTHKPLHREIPRSDHCSIFDVLLRISAFTMFLDSIKIHGKRLLLL